MEQILEMSPKGYNVTRSFEGRALRAYRDIVGVWTIGYGNTNSDASVLGFTIGAGVRITEAQAEQLLQVAMKQRYEPTVRVVMSGADQPTFDATCDFVYNIGTGGLATRSWVKQWKKNKDASGILAYNHAGGNVVGGLTRRRERELAMIKAGDYGPEGANPPAEVTVDSSGRETAGNPPIASTVFPAAAGMLRLGSEGQEVKDFQAALTASGFPVDVDGVYGPATEAACARFQQAHSQLDVDGVGGPATRAALQRGVDLASKAKRATVAGVGGGAPLAADHTLHATPFLPTWSLILLGVAFVSTLAYVAWQYRDEIAARFKRAPAAPPAPPATPLPAPVIVAHATETAPAPAPTPRPWHPPL